MRECDIINIKTRPMPNQKHMNSGLRRLSTANQKNSSCSWRISRPQLTGQEYVGGRKNKLSTYSITWGITQQIWRTRKPEHWNKQCTLKVHTRGFTWVFPSINDLSKQKRAMRRAIRKSCEILFKTFAARLMKLNNYLPLFPGFSAPKKMPPEELNEILLHAVPNDWAKHAFLQGWDF